MKLYFEILNESHSDAIQTELYKLGYGWQDHNNQTVISLNKTNKYIITGLLDNRSIHFSDKLDIRTKSYRKCTIDELIAYHEAFSDAKIGELTFTVNTHFKMIRFYRKELTFDEVKELGKYINSIK